MAVAKRIKIVSTAMLDGAVTRMRCWRRIACRMSSTKVDVFPVPGCEHAERCFFFVKNYPKRTQIKEKK